MSIPNGIKINIPVTNSSANRRWVILRIPNATINRVNGRVNILLCITVLHRNIANIIGYATSALLKRILVYVGSIIPLSVSLYVAVLYFWYSNCTIAVSCTR